MNRITYKKIINTIINLLIHNLSVLWIISMWFYKNLKIQNFTLHKNPWTEKALKSELKPINKQQTNLHWKFEFNENGHISKTIVIYKPKIARHYRAERISARSDIPVNSQSKSFPHYP